MEGKSYLIDEEQDRVQIHHVLWDRSIMTATATAFVRNMKSSQDSINFKEAKLNHILASQAHHEQRSGEGC